MFKRPFRVNNEDTRTTSENISTTLYGHVLTDLPQVGKFQNICKAVFLHFLRNESERFHFFPVRFSHLRREMLSATEGFYRGSGCCELLYRSSRPKLFCRKDVLKNFAKFGRKDLCQSLCFNKAAGHRPATLLKRRLWYRCFPVNFVKFLQISFLREHLRWILLFSDRFQCQNP